MGFLSGLSKVGFVENYDLNVMLDFATSLFFEQFLKRIVWVIEKKSVAMFWTHQTKT